MVLSDVMTGRRRAVRPPRHHLGATCLAPLLALLWPLAAAAQTDEIQVYDAGITQPGTYEVTLHDNYAPDGLTRPRYPGATISNHSDNGTVESAYGVADWWELGLYFPVFTLAQEHGGAQFDGAKLRSLFVVPDAGHQTFFYGINFELSFSNAHWEQPTPSLEIRPILGLHLGKWDLIENPIVDTGLNGIGNASFAPEERIAYNFNETYAVAAEHYADYGPTRAPPPLAHSYQELFAVTDVALSPHDSVEVGAGFGLTNQSDRVLLKLIVNHHF